MTGDLYKLRYRLSGASTRVREAEITNMCPLCFAGAVLVSPVVIRFERELKARPIVYAGREWLVERDLMERVGAAGLKGMAFRQAKLEKGGTFHDCSYFELSANHVLPALSPKSRIDRERACSRCGRGGFFEIVPWTDEVLVYERRSLATLPKHDFFLTHEYSGDLFPPGKPQLGSLFPQQSLMISSRAKDFFEEAKVRGLIYQRVNTVDS